MHIEAQPIQVSKVLHCVLCARQTSSGTHLNRLHNMVQRLGPCLEVLIAHCLRSPQPPQEEAILTCMQLNGM